MVLVLADEPAKPFDYVVCAAKRAKSMAVSMLFAFVDRFQNAANDVLSNWIGDIGYSEWPLFPWNLSCAAPYQWKGQ